MGGGRVVGGSWEGGGRVPGGWWEDGCGCSPQPVNKHEILPSTGDEALFQSSVSERSLLKCERVLDTLDAPQEGPEIPVPTKEEPRVSHHNSRRAPFSPFSNRDEGRFPCFVRKGIPTSLSDLRRRPVSP